MISELKQMVQAEMDKYTSANPCTSCNTDKAIFDIKDAGGGKLATRVFCCCEPYQSKIAAKAQEIMQSSVAKLASRKN